MIRKKTMDGNTAAAYVSYAFTEMAAIYPITPSSPMAELVDEWAAEGRNNIFGGPVRVVELQSEAGAAGTVHGSLKTGTFTSTYTSSQGLLLMIPNMYKIAGELLPTVFHVAARAVSSNALCIFGDHSDVMAARGTGFAMLAEGSVQEVMDLSIVAHLSTIDASIPFVNFFDGFRTSHEIQKIDVPDYEDIKHMLNKDRVAAFRERGMSPNHPTATGSSQGPELFFQQREAVNGYYEKVPDIVSHYMSKINKLRGTNYDLVNYYGAPDAERVIVAMGSVTSVIEQAVDYLTEKGEKVGLLSIHLYRPFPTDKLLEKIPVSVKSIAVLDRTKEPGSSGEPLLLDVQSAFFDSERRPRVIGGRYGLGSKDVTPSDILAVYAHLESKPLKQRFTIGIDDDVTHLSLESFPSLDLTPEGTFQAKFWGFGSDGTVGANKASIKLIGDHSDLNVQGYFSYDSKKSGGLTISHLRFGSRPVKSAYLVAHADFIACHAASYVRTYDLLKGLKPGGTFLLNTIWNDQQLERRLPNNMKVYLAKNKIRFYTINAIGLAGKIGLGRRINTIMQTAFFRLTNIIPFDQAIEWLRQSAVDTYGRKSMAVAELNVAAINQTVHLLHEVTVPDYWESAADAKSSVPVSSIPRDAHFVLNILKPMNRQEGDSIKISTLIRENMADGSLPLGTSVYEKRNVALQVPEWNAETCILCNQCAFVCPHAAIRPFLADAEEMERAPEGFITRTMRGADGLRYRIQVSVADCTGCGLCVEACPKAGEALRMKPAEAQQEQSVNWAFAMTLKAKTNPVKKATIQGSQFEKPLLEFSGACSGCGETPYVKLLTQLFGDRMMIANATGCSSIWGASSPVVPYTTDEKGHGPAWSNSLFEDNAEFGLGMKLARDTRRKRLAAQIEKALTLDLGDPLKHAMSEWFEHMNEGENTRQRAETLEELLLKEKNSDPLLEVIYQQRDLFIKTSQWIIGGDGWAYDIDFGGLDHVLASGEDVNILVTDNEVYANTGGQSSKGTPAAAVAQFAASGKRTAKKDLGMMAINYGNVYVAQIASGANKMQTIKALIEAERYPGPSLVIAYTPCISHGLRGGLGHALREADEAVKSGYWSLYRYDPERSEKGAAPMQLDFRRPHFDHIPAFMMTQTRFSALRRINPQIAEQLFNKTKQDAKTRFFRYARLTDQEEKIKAGIETLKA
ncbi:pyruvate:ferredoxin (flavodoxin) oxidoreductase [Sporolactobacillus sp. CPB3-1]|uniref:Pyruvate:ferredoxin (Flavodoxin) oxidoreductase n=1 Tax=Sporolactobacillus mangiferae TaxID=2940498 RepID=A0ABT0M8Z1_9BACL|nr:pyruvate:ferredoxin (flavodoxin) oxidoreductase [Sporolactobacillus mangiferae]MCL1631063.1 pyruvate:ferredoxin (flavodoxin) oxidoreductase [Sporolactobacillus mangiferae]